MKTRLIALLLLAVFAASVFSGCVNAAAQQPDAPANPTEAPASDVPATANEPASPQPQGAGIPVDWLTKEDAIATALKDAALVEEQVIHRRAEFDYEQGQPVWEVEFCSGDREYDYDIHAETGQILFRESEPEKAPKKAEQPVAAAPATVVPATKAPATEPPATEPEVTRLSKEEVYAIALAHAGLSRDQVSRLKAEFDYDDGRPEYDVEFKYDGWEYEYEVHAESGKILSSDKDRDD